MGNCQRCDRVVSYTVLVQVMIPERSFERATMGTEYWCMVCLFDEAERVRVLA